MELPQYIIWMKKKRVGLRYQEIEVQERYSKRYCGSWNRGWYWDEL